MIDTRMESTHLLQPLAGGWRAAALDPPNHPSIHTPLHELAADLAMGLRDRDEVASDRVEDILVLDERRRGERR